MEWRSLGLFVVAAAVGWKLLGLWQDTGNVVNVDKLLFDLGNSANPQNVTAAATSIAFLASVPKLSAQLQTPEVLSSLLRVAHNVLKSRSKQQQEHLASTMCVVAVSRIVQGSASSAQHVLDAGGLGLCEQALKADIASLHASTSVLLQALHAHRPAQVGEWVVANHQRMLGRSLTLMEGGAYSNSSDALTAAAQLLELVALQRGPAAAPADSHDDSGSGSSGGAVCDKVKSEEVQRVLLQVFITFTNQSEVAGAVARVWVALAADDTASAKQLADAGVIAPLLVELRRTQEASLAPLLRLAGALLAVPEAADELVSGGLMSVCAQLYFQANATTEARELCHDLLMDISGSIKDQGHSGGQQQGGKRDRAGQQASDADADADVDGSRNGGSHSAVRGVATTELEGLDEDDSDGDEGDEQAREGPGKGRQQQQQQQQQQGGSDSKTPSAKDVRIMVSLLRMIRESKLPALHNAVLDALRDAAAVSTGGAAVGALAQAGGVPLMAHILKQNFSAMKGTFEQRAWLLHSQRSASAVLALMALQPYLRDTVVQQGGVHALASCITSLRGQPGMMQQVRITAAAALVPILGDDTRHHEAVVISGVLEDLIYMYKSRVAAERQVAARAMGLLAAHAPVRELFAAAGFKPEEAEAAGAAPAAAGAVAAGHRHRQGGGDRTET